MKKILLAATILFILAACNNSKDTKFENTESTRIDPVTGAPVPVAEIQPIDSAIAPRMSFEKTTHDFGTITTGEKVTYGYKFKNTGKSPLIITEATASCGCTVPEFPKKPVNPGEDDIIKVVFDSKGKTGMQHKDITITSNAIPAISELQLTGQSKEAKK